MSEIETPSEVGEEEQTTSVSQAIGREKLEVTSGYVALIDQFMLGNKQFLVKIGRLRRDLDNPEQVEEKLREVIETFGGCLVKVETGTHSVYRNPMESLMVVCEGLAEKLDAEQEYAEEFEQDIASLISSKQDSTPVGRVFVDTRCVVFCDVSLFGRAALLDEFRRMRASGNEKDARDLLRNNGAAVRYGFNRYGDELGVFRVTNDSQEYVALWPDVVLEEESVH